MSYLLLFCLTYKILGICKIILYNFRDNFRVLELKLNYTSI